VRRQSASPKAAVGTPAEPVPGSSVATKILFAPVKIVSKRVAPRLSRRLFSRLWSVIDDHAPPPRAEERQDSVAKLALALALEGACAAIVSGLLDQVSRRRFARLTGRWPGRGAKS
jgi:Protein of unknown function (DUF4235)